MFIVSEERPGVFSVVLQGSCVWCRWMAVFMFNDRRQQQEQQEMKMVKSKSCWDSLPMLLVQSNIAACLSLFIFFFFNVITSLFSFNSFYPTIKFFLLIFFLGPLGFKLSSWFVFCPDSDLMCSWVLMMFGWIHVESFAAGTCFWLFCVVFVLFSYIYCTLVTL